MGTEMMSRSTSDLLICCCGLHTILKSLWALSTKDYGPGLAHVCDDCSPCTSGRQSGGPQNNRPIPRPALRSNPATIPSGVATMRHRALRDGHRRPRGPVSPRPGAQVRRTRIAAALSTPCRCLSLGEQERQTRYFLACQVHPAGLYQHSRDCVASASYYWSRVASSVPFRQVRLYLAPIGSR